MTLSFMRDVGAYLLVKEAFNPVVINATSTADGTTITGTVHDRRSFADHYNSAKLCVEYYGLLSTADNVVLTLSYQHSDSTNSTGFTNFTNKDGSTMDTVTKTKSTTTNSSIPSGVLSADLDLSGAKRYLRARLLPTLSATESSAGDTVDIGGTWVFGGCVTPPAA